MFIILKVLLSTKVCKVLPVATSLLWFSLFTVYFNETLIGVISSYSVSIIKLSPYLAASIYLHWKAS